MYAFSETYFSDQLSPSDPHTASSFIQSTVFEETASVLSCHSDVRMAVPAQRNVCQKAVWWPVLWKRNQEKCVQMTACPLTSPLLSLHSLPQPSFLSEDRDFHRQMSIGKESTSVTKQLFFSCLFVFYLFYVFLASSTIFNHDLYNFIMDFILWKLKELLVSWSSLDVCICFNSLISTHSLIASERTCASAVTWYT